MSKIPKCPTNWLLFSLYVYTLVSIVAFGLLNEPCKLSNGKNGTCLYYKDCATLFEIANGTNQRKICGKDGSKRIICCEIPRPVNHTGIGSISLRKCNESYFSPYFTRYNISIWLDENGVPTGFGYGGERAASEEYKHMAALGFGNGTNIRWLCGGSLISEKFVMTAAHCTASRTYGVVSRVRLGDLDLYLTNDTAEPQDFNIARIFIHPDYAPPAVYNDIALIELDGVANFTRFVSPACLNCDFVIDPPPYFYTATGWGVTGFEGYQPNHLQEMLLKDYPMDECRKDYQSTGKRQLPYGLNETIQLCAGSRSADTCQGDSGGPLQMTNYKYLSGHTVLGITSFGKACGFTNAPGVYTRVSYYVGWIEAIVWPDEE